MAGRFGASAPGIDVVRNDSFRANRRVIARHALRECVVEPEINWNVWRVRQLPDLLRTLSPHV